MPGEKQERRANPFQIAGIGLLLLMAGLALKTHVAAYMEDAERQRVLSRQQEQVANSAKSLGSTVRPHRQRMQWEAIGQMVFFLGLGLVAAGGVIWYRQAHQPEPQPDVPADDPLASDGQPSQPQSPLSS
jgi:hypothetical protein